MMFRFGVGEEWERVASGSATESWHPYEEVGMENDIKRWVRAGVVALAGS